MADRCSARRSLVIPRFFRPLASCLALLSCVLPLSCASGPGATGPVGQKPATDAELVAAVLRTYQTWTVADALSPKCSVYFTACADFFARRAGFDPQDLRTKNPRALLLSNPDPVWLPGWDALPQGPEHRHLAFAALTYAASMREHFEACGAVHKADEAKRATLDAFLDAEVAKLEGDNQPYRRLGALARARGELKRMDAHPIGARYRAEVLLHYEFSRHNRQRIYDLQNQRADDAALLRPSFSSQDELDLVCMKDLPSWQDNESLPVSFVKIPITRERAAALVAKLKAAQDLEARIPLAEVAVPPFKDSPAPHAGALLRLDRAAIGVPLFVKKVSDDKDGRLLLELGGKATVKDAPHDCRPSDKPDSVDPGGKIRYDTECKRWDEARQLRVVVRLAERPDFTIQKDDQIVVIGMLVKLDTRRQKQGTGEAVDHAVEIDGLHVLEIWRQQLLVADYFVQ